MPTSKTQVGDVEAPSVEYREYLHREALYKAFSWISFAEALDRDAARAPGVLRDRARPGALRRKARDLVKASGLKEIETMRAEHGDEATRRRLLGAHPEHWEGEFGSPYMEQLALSPENPCRKLNLAISGKETEEFTSTRGWIIIDAVHEFTPEHYDRFVEFHADKRKGKRAGESYQAARDDLDEALDLIVLRTRKRELRASGLLDGAPRPEPINEEALGSIRWKVVGLPEISESELVINGLRYTDVRFQYAKAATRAEKRKSGRPSLNEKYLAEAERRADAGEMFDVKWDEADYLAGWCRTNCKGETPPTPKAIYNALTATTWKRLKEKQRESAAQKQTRNQTRN